MQIHERRNLPDAGVLHLGRPHAVRQPDFRQGGHDRGIGVDLRVDGRDAVQDLG